MFCPQTVQNIGGFTVQNAEKKLKSMQFSKIGNIFPVESET